MSYKLITAPTTTPITLAETKAHLRVDSPDEDALITALIDAATARFDGPTGILGRALMPQTWDLFLDVFPAEPAIKLPFPPLASVTGVYYFDAVTEAEATFAAANYEVDTYSIPGWVQLAADASWPEIMETINAVRVRFVAGYASAAAVPAPIKAAMLLMIGDLFEHRETAVVGASASAIPLSATIQALTDPYRVTWA